MQGFKIRVTGKVQGVYFRKSTLQSAREMGIKGWVRNMPDGTVEIWAEGEEMAMESFVKWCHSGPKNAVVALVEKEPVICESYSDFRIV